LLQKLPVIVSADHHPGSGRRRSIRTADNTDLVYELMLNTKMFR